MSVLQTALDAYSRIAAARGARDHPAAYRGRPCERGEGSEQRSTAEVVGHNLQFDVRFLARLGFTPGRVFDTMLASQVLHAGRREASAAPLRHMLRDVARRELGRDLNKGLQAVDWSGRLAPDHLTYAATYAAVLVPLSGALTERLTASDLLATADLEMRALPGVAWAAPVTVDRDAWLGLAAAAEAERAGWPPRWTRSPPTRPACRGPRPATGPRRTRCGGVQGGRGGPARHDRRHPVLAELVVRVEAPGERERLPREAVGLGGNLVATAAVALRAVT